jgi:hypothetical protein
MISGQVVDRSRKSDSLPIEQAQAGDERQITLPVTDRTKSKIKNDCNKPPIDVIGRCFADAGPLRHDLLLSPDQYLMRDQFAMSASGHKVDIAAQMPNVHY